MVTNFLKEVTWIVWSSFNIYFFRSICAWRSLPSLTNRWRIFIQEDLVVNQDIADKGIFHSWSLTTVDGEILCLAKLSMKVPNGFSAWQLAVTQRGPNSAPVGANGGTSTGGKERDFHLLLYRKRKHYKRKLPLAPKRDINPNVYQHPESCTTNLASKTMIWMSCLG